MGLEQVKSWDSHVQELGNALMAGVVPRRLSELHWNLDTYSISQVPFQPRVGAVLVRAGG